MYLEVRRVFEDLARVSSVNYLPNNQIPISTC